VRPAGGSGERERLDRLLVLRGLAPTRARARDLVAAGAVQVGGRPATKPAALLALDAAVGIVHGAPVRVGRGGAKLESALDRLGVSPAGRIAIDLGASTGGFTECLLRRGARAVVAVDVGRDQMDPALAADPRVLRLEGVNARDLTPEALPSGARAADLLVCDLSFISLRLVLPAIRRLLEDAPAGIAEAVILVKPQFELGPGRSGRRGVVRRPAERAEALTSVARAAAECGLRVEAIVPSAIPGRTGNIEFFMRLSFPAGGGCLRWPEPHTEALIVAAAREAADRDTIRRRRD